MNISSPAARRAATAAAVTCGGAFATALLAACGSQPAHSTSAAAAGRTSSPSPSATPSSPSGSSPSDSPTSEPTARTLPRMPATQCPTSALRAKVSKTRGGAAAGTRYVALDLTNTSSHSCNLYGFPGVSFVTGNPGSQIGAAASRQRTFGPETVALASGATAHAWIGLVNTGNFSPSDCGPVTAHWVKVYPPDQFTALYTQFTAKVCSKKVSTSSPLLILPIRPGAGAPGRVP